MSHPHSSEYLLQLLQRYLKLPNQIKQIHSLVITQGYLVYKSNVLSTSKWTSTLLYNTLIRSHLSFGQANKTLFLFTQMLAHQTPLNSYTFPSIIKAASSCSPSLGTPLHNQAFKRGVLSDLFVQTTFVSFYAQFGKLCDACKMFEEITEPCIVAYNAMLHAYGRNGDMGSALLLFKQMPKLDAISWTSMINGYFKNGCFTEAIQFFKKMMTQMEVLMSSLVKPTEATYVSVLSSCANLDRREALYVGKQIHGYIIRHEIELTVFLGTALSDFYGKSGCLNSSANVFNQMIVKEICTWNAMISTLSSHGREKEALALFGRLKEEGLQPNEITFVALLTACARGQLVDSGMELFRSMRIDFGLMPIMEHYGCMVDLLGRAGLFTEATELVKGMPFEPDASVLGALLGACKIHGTTKLGNEVGQKLIHLQPQHSGRYVVLSNINAGMERWDHAAHLRKLMLNDGIRKTPAYSMVS